MAELCRFAGIIITINPRDHNPPHFHARYAEHETWIEISNLQVGGEEYFPLSQLHVLLDWAMVHQDELMAAWNAVRAGKKPEKILP